MFSSYLGNAIKGDIMIEKPLDKSSDLGASAPQQPFDQMRS
jgi:hypothetical protein